MEGLELMCFILARGKGERLLALCADRGLSFSVLLRGHGTAGTEILSILGIGDPEKDIVLLSASRDRADEIMLELAGKMGLERPGTGIAFSIPFSAAASQFMTYELFAGSLAAGRESSPVKKLFGSRPKRSKEQ